MILPALLALCLAQEPPKVPYLTPEQAAAKMTYPAAFELTIFAAEPEIAQPIAFTFDAKGRIWVVENFNYRTRGSHTPALAGFTR